GVVGTEADLAFLRSVRNNALLGAAEVVIVKVLKPHSGDEQEVPAVSAALLDVFNRAIAGDAAVFRVSLLSCPECLVKLPKQVDQFEMFGGLERIIIARQRQRHAEDGKEPPA